MRRKLNASALEMTSATSAHFLFLMGEIRSRQREWSLWNEAIANLNINGRFYPVDGTITKSRIPQRICHGHEARGWSTCVDEANAALSEGICGVFNRAEPKAARNRWWSTSLLTLSFPNYDLSTLTIFRSRPGLIFSENSLVASYKRTNAFENLCENEY